MRSFFAILLSFVSLSSVARADGDFCQAVPRLEALGQTRCANFTQFSDSAVAEAERGCRAYYGAVKKAAESLCELGHAVDRHDAENRALAPKDAQLRTFFFLRNWSNKLAFGPRRDLELAYVEFKESAAALNFYGLELLREEATGCGRAGTAPSPAFIGLALTSAYEAAHVHDYMGAVFTGLADAMAREADLREKLKYRGEGLPAKPPAAAVPGAEEPDHPVTPAVKGLITEALSHILHLQGFQGFGLDLVDKLLISQKFDLLDLAVMGAKAVVIVAGGTSAGPTFGISLGITVAINGAIDYLEYSIRLMHSSFERLAYARMDEVLTFHACQLRRNRHLGSAELSQAYHNHRRDGLCGASCADRGLFGMCRPSVVFTADRCY